MEYPIFDVPFLGGSLLIAGVAVFHAFIAHFSVGAGFFVALAERRAIREDDAATMAFLKKYALLILLVPYILGTVTGVGIWFTVALVSPRAIGLLIHQFVWDWAIEWVFFLIEVAAIYLYFFTWGKVAPRAHNRIGWIFAGASLLTLAVINAILSFMLTPGAWAPHVPGAVWKGIFNPSYVPTTLIRALIAFALAGVGAIALVTFVKTVDERVRRRVVSLAYWMIAPCALCALLGGWVFAVLPERAKLFLQGGAPVMAVFLAFGLASFGILTFSAILALVRRDFSTSTIGSCLLVLLAFVSFGSFEFVREGVRKPYLIDGFLYSTGVSTLKARAMDPRANIATLREKGVLSAAPWAVPPGAKLEELPPIERGRCVYRAACLRCHQVDGYNALRPLIHGWSRATVRDLIEKANEVKPSMPPFPGTDAEKEDLTAFLMTLNPQQEGAAR